MDTHMQVMELRLVTEAGVKAEVLASEIARSLDCVLGAVVLAPTGFGHLIANPETITSAIVAVNREDRNAARLVCDVLLSGDAALAARGAS